MDKLMNASNASNIVNTFKDGEYVYYVVKELDGKDSYTLKFIGESPKDKNKFNVNLNVCEHYKNLDTSTEERVNSKYNAGRVLADLYECEEPGYCFVRDGKLFVKNLYSMKKVTRKRVMMVSPTPELITEDMSTYKIPKWSNSNDVGSAGWFMQKYINKPEGCTVINALIFNDFLVDIEWVRAAPTRHNLLDRLQYFTQSIGWTPEEIVNYLGTGNKNGKH